ncbi:hypothetical protein AVEN_244335-1 [Araneus ventricosus]|uniref:Uncharacterized protein n=1 Tax=Araneus ventricosus TaxID=182803 RepID=A0A4Y2WB98_ARAVE|nr:hypothetical protein AVEN_244335-1 [Araneus ventricosus]
MLKIHRECEPLALPISHVGEEPRTHSVPAHPTGSKAHNRTEEGLVWCGCLEKGVPSRVSFSLSDDGSKFQGTEQRCSEDRLRTIARRNNMTTEETEERRSDDQLRAIARRNNESFEVRNQRQASGRLRTLNSRATESNEQRERRIHCCNALGNQNRI